ncbi:MAG: carbohydrate ABC transporter permease [Oscillospiraceae bacterium]|nr:carbohydrate ABC transporter permease [Oscillospiraceae bacterium]
MPEFLKMNFAGYFDFILWKPLYLKSFFNSAVIALTVSLGSALIALFASYVFAKVKFKGREFLFYLYIIVMMMPFQVTLLPQYIVSKNLLIYDTPAALILPGIFTPFAVFLLTQIVRTIPDYLIEAARMETKSTFVIITKIILPQVKTGLVCLIVLNFTECWNMIAEPLVLMETVSKFPLSVRIPEMLSKGDIGAAAASFVFIIPPILLYMFFKDEIVDGLASYKLK